jgi:formamidopyrimidine-DNA glycosylase
MPELPEVETIRRSLRSGNDEKPSLLGKVIRRAELYWERSLAQPGKAEFVQRVTGQTIEEIGRRGKFLVFRLNRDALLVHLRMSGDLWLEDSKAPIAPHHRAALSFDDGWRLAFNDPRKFGRLWLTSDPAEILGGLGPEPLDEAFSAVDLYERLHSRKRQLKPLLMDQSFLAGLGNIYTDEALNLARLHPLLSSDEATPEQSDRLRHSIRVVLEDGIRLNGASIDWVFRGGDYQNHLRVYGRKDQPCRECGTLIQRITVGQRSTYYCPFCQVIFNPNQL